MTTSSTEQQPIIASINADLQAAQKALSSLDKALEYVHVNGGIDRQGWLSPGASAVLHRHVREALASVMTAQAIHEPYSG